MENTKEEWMDVVGYEELYQVSNFGHIKSLKRNKLLKPSATKQGYQRVCLSKNGITQCFQIHRLVASHFLKNPDNLPEINHRDEDKTNNCASNLEWCDRKFNINYGTRTDRATQKRCKQIVCVETGITYQSIKEASLLTKINSGNICSVLKGNQKTAGGFHWKYLI